MGIAGRTAVDWQDSDRYRTRLPAYRSEERASEMNSVPKSHRADYLCMYVTQDEKRGPAQSMDLHPELLGDTYTNDIYRAIIFSFPSQQSFFIRIIRFLRNTAHAFPSNRSSAYHPAALGGGEAQSELATQEERIFHPSSCFSSNARDSAI